MIRSMRFCSDSVVDFIPQSIIVCEVLQWWNKEKEINKRKWLHSENTLPSSFYIFIINWVVSFKIAGLSFENIRFSSSIQRVCEFYRSSYFNTLHQGTNKIIRTYEVNKKKKNTVKAEVHSNFCLKFIVGWVVGPTKLSNHKKT